MLDVLKRSFFELEIPTYSYSCATPDICGLLAAAGSPVAAVPEAGRCKLAQFMWRTDVWGKGSQPTISIQVLCNCSTSMKEQCRSTTLLDLKIIQSDKNTF